MKILKIPRDKDFYLGIPLVTQGKTGEQTSLSLEDFSELPVVTMRSMYGERYLPVVSAHIDTKYDNVLVAKVRPETDKMLSATFTIDLDGYLKDLHVLAKAGDRVQLVRTTVQSNVEGTKYGDTDILYYELDAVVVNECKEAGKDYKKKEEDKSLKAIDAQLHRNEEKINAEVLRAQSVEEDFKTTLADTVAKVDEELESVIKMEDLYDTVTNPEREQIGENIFMDTTYFTLNTYDGEVTMSFSKDVIEQLGSLDETKETVTELLGSFVTKIGAGYIYTGTIASDQIIAGEKGIIGIDIKSDSLDEPSWQILADGTGYLAKGNIKWGSDGSTEINGKLTSAEGEIGGWTLAESGLTRTKTTTLSDDESEVQKYSVDEQGYSTEYNKRKTFIENGETYIASASTSKVTLDAKSLKISQENYTPQGSTYNSLGLDPEKGLWITADGADYTEANTPVKLSPDGSGWLAGKNFTWETDGSVTLKGKIESEEGTIGGWQIGESEITTEDDTFKLDSNLKRIYLGGEGGAIYIQPSGIYAETQAWAFSCDGSGQLANGNITWTADGDFLFSDGTHKMTMSSSDGLIVGDTSTTPGELGTSLYTAITNKGINLLGGATGVNGSTTINHGSMTLNTVSTTASGSAIAVTEVGATIDGTGVTLSGNRKITWEEIYSLLHPTTTESES